MKDAQVSNEELVAQISNKECLCAIQHYREEDGSYTIKLTTPLSSVETKVPDQKTALDVYTFLAKRVVETMEGEMDFLHSDLKEASRS